MMDAMAKDEQPQFTHAEAIRDEENHEARPVVNAANAFDKAEEVKADEVAEQTDDKPDF
jgi:hypothetical protein